MSIRFWATVTLSEDREVGISGGSRYSPNLRFDLPGISHMRFGLTVLDDVDWPLLPGETKLAQFNIGGHPDMEPLAHQLKPGTSFEMLNGWLIDGRGVVEEIDESTIDR
jgi:hypothetical protein